MARVKMVQPRVSYTDLERAPEDGRRYELYNGEVFLVPAPLPRHQVVQHLIAELLRAHAAGHGGFAVGSPIDIVFTDYNVLQPDVVFFRGERQHLVDLDAPIRHAPDICVEVVSPSTEATDRGRKMQMFARFGVPEYWIVNPQARSIEVYQLSGEAYALMVLQAQVIPSARRLSRDSPSTQRAYSRLSRVNAAQGPARPRLHDA